MQVLSRQRGVSLIEVMMAVLIFSIGLLGLAGLMIMATRSNVAGYQFTQVSYLAHNMADRMSANPIGVWNGSYNSAAYPVSTTQDCSAGCTPALLAAYDQQMWSSQLKTFLPPGAAAVIACTSTGVSFDPVGGGQVDKRPPYGGTCAMRITWNERNTGDQTAQSATTQTQTFAWEFQP
ncbi:type IV pilus modification protein PilV [Rhodanobacter sp. C05]|uniref:type IV pilus modification protein PilV n=1 Tax=Rhodanobacter sp. C05 TaxID=1945855 RepID=UPI0009CF7095|nr:type IV pilus modification protein PilV [Rhodanobacter sp. C05]OOG40639.1 type IV pilus modification protein PilV [Rhodanobacter sp. C05]